MFITHESNRKDWDWLWESYLDAPDTLGLPDEAAYGPAVKRYMIEHFGIRTELGLQLYNARKFEIVDMDQFLIAKMQRDDEDN